MLVAEERTTREVASRINWSPGKVSKVPTRAWREVIATAFRQAKIDRGCKSAGGSDDAESEGDPRTEDYIGLEPDPE
jgi:hypothetical protein